MNILPDHFRAGVSSTLRRKSHRQQTKAVIIHSFHLRLSTIFFLLLLLFVASPHHPLVEGAEGVEHCPQWVGDEIQFCVQPVAEFASNLNQQQTEHENIQNQQQQTTLGSEIVGSALQWPTKMGGQVFRVLCRLINDFEMCVDGFRNKCRRHITIDLIEASYGFLCNEGYEIFMASAECLMELDQQPSVKSCHDRTLREIEEANNEQNETAQAKLDRMCNALNYFAECVRPPIRRNCGLEAWRVIYRVLKDTSKTLMPNCGFDEFPEEIATTRKQLKRPPLFSSNDGSKSREYNSEEFGQHPFGRKQSISSTKMPMMGTDDWEQWEEGNNDELNENRMGDEEEDGQGIGVNIEEMADSSSHHQIHYGSHLGQNGAHKISLFNLLLFFPLSILYHFILIILTK